MAAKEYGLFLASGFVFYIGQTRLTQSGVAMLLNAMKIYAGIDEFI